MLEFQFIARWAGRARRHPEGAKLGAATGAARRASPRGPAAGPVGSFAARWVVGKPPPRGNGPPAGLGPGGDSC
ncbi:hypothetical protein [Allomeiothermus silvanus]|uniref:hypothetical protein n=1 Tax=Allomeiothermus silvanus TaxID=52022 RepID=UPI0023F3BDC7|nr:hypothetical protein [Allomeiothermus silvanus]